MIWLLAILQIVFIQINWWSYNACHMRPQYDLPSIFWNPTARRLLLVSPWIGIIGLVIFSFALTKQGGLFLLFTVVWWVLIGYRGFKFIKSRHENIYKPSAFNDRTSEAQSLDDLETANPAGEKDQASAEFKRAVCIKCGNFKASALGKCPDCHFAPETNLDAAKSVLLTIRSFPGGKLNGISENIKGSGLGVIVFPADSLKKMLDSLADKKSNMGVQGILEMNRLENKKLGEAAGNNILGWRHMEGQGVDQNEETAMWFWTLAADQGNAEAKYYLSKLYASEESFVRQD